MRSTNKNVELLKSYPNVIKRLNYTSEYHVGKQRTHFIETYVKIIRYCNMVFEMSIEYGVCLELKR